MRKVYRFSDLHYSENFELQKFVKKYKIENQYNIKLDSVVFYLKSDMPQADKIFKDIKKFTTNLNTPTGFWLPEIENVLIIISKRIIFD